MFAQLFKRAVFSRVISFVVAFSFILTSVPVSYASIFTSDLRTPATRDSSVQEEVKKDLGDRAKPEKIDPLVLSNIISLLKGPQTRGSNIEHAILDGANGGIFNHSEARGDLEDRMRDMLRSVVNLINLGASENEINEKCAKTLEIVGLTKKDYVAEIEAINSWVSRIRKLATSMHTLNISNTDWWLSSQHPDAEKKREAQEKETFDLWIEMVVRQIVNKIMNTQLREVVAYSQKYSFAQTVLCVGETLAQYDAKKPQEVLAQDLKEMLAGITKEDAQKISLRIAYEPRWAIGTGKTPTLEEIQATHRFIKETLKGILGVELDVDYGGSLNERNCPAILALPDVDGGLIGSAAKTPAAISPVIDEAIKQGQIKGKLLNIGMNWKAENPKTGLSPVDAFVELFRTKDLSRVHIAIGTPNVKLVRDVMTKLEDEISAVSLYSRIVAKSETVGTSFTKETLAARSQATEALYKELEKRFGEKTREGDVYFRLKLGNRYFALAKENIKDGTLMTAATLDLGDPKTKDEYYAALLDYVSLLTIQADRIELIEEKGDRIKQYLSSPSSIIPPSISITFKETNRPIARGWSLVVEPVEKKEPYATIPQLVDLKESDLKGKTIVARVDYNIPNLKSILRIEASIPGILYAIDNGATVVLTTHYGRPGGKVDLRYSVKPLADILKRLLVEQGRGNIPVNFLEGSVTEKGLQEGLKAKIIPGAINVLENMRFCPGEEKNDPAFAKALAGLGDISNFAGFSAGERVHGSTAGLAGYMQKIVLDPSTIKEEQFNRDILKTLYGVIFGGGPKVSEKIGTLRSIVQNMQEGGYVIIGTGPLPAFLKAMYNIEIGQKAEDADVAAAKEIIGLAQKRKVRILLPNDFVAIYANLSEKAEGDKTWLDLRRLPDDRNAFNITLEELKRSPHPLFIYDIGPKSISEFKQVLRNTPKDQTIFWNGPVGVYEMPKFETGTKELAITLGEISKNDTRSEGVKGVIGGGDTASAMEQFGVVQQLTFVSTGGGASLALLEGKELTAIVKLAEIQASINNAVHRIIRTADNTVYSATSADYGNFINAAEQIRRDRGWGGNVVIGANAIFENAGAISALKGSPYHVVVWAQNKTEIEALKLMGIQQVTKELISQEDMGLKSLMIKFSGRVQPVVLITSPLDRKDINLDEIQKWGVRIVNLQTPKAKEEAKINSMPLIIARAITGTLQTEEAVVKQFKELSQNYLKNNQISEEDLKNLTNFPSGIYDVPLVQLTKEKDREVLEAQITYEATQGEI